MTYEEWVMAMPEHLERLFEDARSYHRQDRGYGGSGIDYLDENLTNKKEVGFVDVDVHDGYVKDVKIPRSWFIDPNWRRQKEAEFAEKQEERERRNQEQIDRHFHRESARGYISTVRELEGLEAAQRAEALMKEKGWL